MLGTSGASVKGALQRARATLEERRPAAARRGAPRGSAMGRELTRRFADAFQADDVDGLVDLLTDDAWLTMPPAPHQYQGVAAIASFLRASAAWRAGRRFRLVATRANTQPAFGCYLEDGRAPTAGAAGLVVLSLDGDGSRPSPASSTWRSWTASASPDAARLLGDRAAGTARALTSAVVSGSITPSTSLTLTSGMATSLVLLVRTIVQSSWGCTIVRLRCQRGGRVRGGPGR